MIPPKPTKSIRLFVYRPQRFVGWFGTAIIIVNGEWMGNADDPFHENMMLPGTVFVVDVPTDVVRVWWYKKGKGEEVARALELSSAKAKRWYLRWSMDLVDSYLVPIEEHQAIPDLNSLRFSGYVNLGAP